MDGLKKSNEFIKKFRKIRSLEFDEIDFPTILNAFFDNLKSVSKPKILHFAAAKIDYNYEIILL